MPIDLLKIWLFIDQIKFSRSFINMSKQKIKVQIEICSNCKSHQWCTRHNEANYSSLAQQIQRSLKAHDSQIEVDIFQVGGQKMGSFQIYCNGTLLFSKLSLGYFPHVPSASARIISFIDDFKKGEDLKKYTEGKGVSPHKTINNNSSHVVSSPNRQTRSPGKRIKYNPDYKDQNKQDQNVSTLSKKHQQNNEGSKKDDSNHKKKTQEHKVQQHKNQKNNEHHKQHKGEDKQKEGQKDHEKNQAAKKQHKADEHKNQAAKQKDQKHQEHRKQAQPKKDDKTHENHKKQQHKTQQHKKQEQKEQKEQKKQQTHKGQQKKAQDPNIKKNEQLKQNTNEAVKHEQKGINNNKKNEAEFVLSENKQKANEQQKPKAQVKQQKAEVILQKEKQNPIKANSELVQNKTGQINNIQLANNSKISNGEQKYDDDFDNNPSQVKKQ